MVHIEFKLVGHDFKQFVFYLVDILPGTSLVRLDRQKIWVSTAMVGTSAIVKGYCTSRNLALMIVAISYGFYKRHKSR